MLWTQEYALLSEISQHEEEEVVYPVLQGNAHHVWDAEIAKLVEASHKTGHGQHAVVNSRVQTLLRFLAGPAGDALKESWLQWRSQRDSTKAEFCLKAEGRLQQLYDDDRDVRLVIGGPPCKGFSRIARPVMQSLREQGASAWTSHEYGDERNALMNQYILFLQAFKPTVFLFENVSNFVSSLKTPNGYLDPALALAEGIEALSGHSLSYMVNSQVIRSADYAALPQERDRYIMIGISAEVADAATAVKEFFNFLSYDDRVPLAVALQGLGMAHEFNWNGNGSSGDSSKVKPTTRTESPAYTLLDPDYPRSWQRYITSIRQAHPTRSARTTDASHIYRGLRRDDTALLELLGPGQRWMDYEVKNAKTLAQLSLALDRMQDSGLLSKKNRKDAEYLAWSTVHGLALLVLEGPLHQMPQGMVLALGERLVLMVERGLE